MVEEDSGAHTSEEDLGEESTHQMLSVIYGRGGAAENADEHPTG
jgi:hypothetical protein